MARKVKKGAAVGVIVAAVAIVAVIGTLIYNSFKEIKYNGPVGTIVNDVSELKPNDNNAVRITLDEWIGFESMIKANGGLETTPDSFYGKKGLNIEFVITNDADVSSMALVKGETVGAGYTVNRFAFLENKFKESNVEVKMPVITNYSNGSDGIIAKSDISNINDLVGKKIAIPKFSEAQTLVEWFLSKSDLTAEQKQQIHNDMVECSSPDETAKAFFAGQVDAAATWEPFLTQAATKEGSHVLMDTSQATNLILDGVVFRQDFMDKNPEFMKSFIEGVLEYAPDYGNPESFDIIRQLPMFSTMTDDEIAGMAAGAAVTNYADNKELMNGTAQNMFKEMSQIWLSVNEKAYPDEANNVFTDKYLEMIDDKYKDVKSQKPDQFSTQAKKEAESKSNEDSLLSKKLDIKFKPDSVELDPASYAALDDFVAAAQVLNGTYIQIEGNTAPIDKNSQEEKEDPNGKKFAKERAQSVAKYLQLKGIDGERLIIVGNGDEKPIADNSTEEGKAENRRTDIYFKTTGR